MNIGIIGGGVSGFVAAIKASSNGCVTILEKNSKVLKKLLLTGNGKCNFFNVNQSFTKYHSESCKELKRLLTDDNIHKVLEFWNSLDLVYKIKNGYYYPYSNTSNSVKSVLLNEALKRGVNIVNDCEVLKIIKDKQEFIVTTSLGTYRFDKIIVATGSKAYPQTGSTGFGYDVAKNFGHKIVDVYPSLVQLKSSCGIEKMWKGIRSDVTVAYADKKESGEIQLTEYGVSGICIFNISRNIARSKNTSIIKINFVPWCDDIKAYLNDRASNNRSVDIVSLCESFLNYKLLQAICKYLKLDSAKSWFDLSKEEQDKLSIALQEFSLEITGVNDFTQAQVCSGGISLDELNIPTFESKLSKDLYFIGETVDVDGDCGGYNLTFAVLSGLLCGTNLRGKENA